jgi:hypothetical protein
MDAVEDCPDAMTIAQSYHESKAEAVPRQPVLATELIAALQLRFVGDNQTLVEEAQGLYNAFNCPETCENVVSEIDKLKLLIQKLSQYIWTTSSRGLQS